MAGGFCHVAFILLCCACSTGTDTVIRSEGAAASAKIIPIAQQTNRPAFTDVPSSAWYAEAVNWCVENDIMSGTTNTSFAPQAATTRITVADALYRSEDRPAVSGGSAFSDVEAGSAYANAAAWASANNVMSGYGGGIFGTNDSVTREDLATLLWRYVGEPAANAGESFADESSISAYARTAVNWARANGIINGKPNKNYVGSHFSNYDSFLVLSHFKGHAMANWIGKPNLSACQYRSGKSSTANRQIKLTA